MASSKEGRASACQSFWHTRQAMPGAPQRPFGGAVLMCVEGAPRVLLPPAILLTLPTVGKDAPCPGSSLIRCSAPGGFPRRDYMGLQFHGVLFLPQTPSSPSITPRTPEGFQAGGGNSARRSDYCHLLPAVLWVLFSSEAASHGAF